MGERQVTSYADVWIEILLIFPIFPLSGVTSYAEVWIEMMVIILY